MKARTPQGKAGRNAPEAFRESAGKRLSLFGVTLCWPACSLASPSRPGMFSVTGACGSALMPVFLEQAPTLGTNEALLDASSVIF